MRSILVSSFYKPHELVERTVCKLRFQFGRSNTATTLKVIGVMVYFAIGFVQFFAIIAGVQEWFGFHWLISGWIAFMIAYIPLVGTVTGIMGAVRAWNGRIIGPLRSFVGLTLFISWWE